MIPAATPREADRWLVDNRNCHNCYFFILAWCQSGNNGATSTISQAPLTSYPQQAQPDQTAPPNPYGAGSVVLGADFVEYSED